MEKSIILKEAKKYGYITAIILVLTLVGQGILSFLFPEDILKFEVFTTVTTLVIAYTYFVMLKGISVIADESTDVQLIEATKNFIRVVLTSCVVFAFYGLVIALFPNETVALLTTIILLGTIFYMGVVSLKISKGFKNIELRFGKNAKKAAFWHKVTGWLMVTVVLSLVGVLVSLIADYFMWKLIYQRIKEEISAN